MDAKTRAIVAYLWIIGWVIALVTNNPKDELASFHIRQMLGLMCFGMTSWVIGLFPLIGWFFSLLIALAALVLWIIGLIGAVNGEQKPVPFVGEYFQDWFKGL